MVKWVPEMNALSLAHCEFSDTGAPRDGQIGLKTFTKSRVPWSLASRLIPKGKPETFNFKSFRHADKDK